MAVRPFPLHLRGIARFVLFERLKHWWLLLINTYASNINTPPSTLHVLFIIISWNPHEGSSKTTAYRNSAIPTLSCLQGTPEDFINRVILDGYCFCLLVL